MINGGGEWSPTELDREAGGEPDRPAGEEVKLEGEGGQLRHTIQLPGSQVNLKISFKKCGKKTRIQKKVILLLSKIGETNTNAYKLYICIVQRGMSVYSQIQC